VTDWTWNLLLVRAVEEVTLRSNQSNFSIIEKNLDKTKGFTSVLVAVKGVRSVKTFYAYFRVQGVLQISEVWSKYKLKFCIFEWMYLENQISVLLTITSLFVTIQLWIIAEKMSSFHLWNVYIQQTFWKPSRWHWKRLWQWWDDSFWTEWRAWF